MLFIFFRFAFSELACYQRRLTTVPGDRNLSISLDPKGFILELETIVYCYGTPSSPDPRCFGYVMVIETKDGRQAIRKELGCLHGRTNVEEEQSKWIDSVENAYSSTPEIVGEYFTCKKDKCNEDFIDHKTSTTKFDNLPGRPGNFD